MSSDMRSPDKITIDSWAEGDVVGETRQEGPRVGDSVKIVQVLVRVKENTDPAALQASEEERLSLFRRVRDQMRRYLRGFPPA